MSLYSKPASILDMPAPPHGTHLDLTPKFAPVVNTSDDAILRSIESAAKHHHSQFTEIAVPSGMVVPDTLDEDYPRHVHSTVKPGDVFTANSEDHHAALLESGDWSDTPLEIVKEKP